MNGRRRFFMGIRGFFFSSAFFSRFSTVSEGISEDEKSSVSCGFSDHKRYVDLYYRGFEETVLPKVKFQSHIYNDNNKKRTRKEG
jgi:hypothetical protein